MNVWKKIYIERLVKEERLLDILAQEYDRIGKSDKHKEARKRKVKEIKEQCEVIRKMRREYKVRSWEEGSVKEKQNGK